MSELVTAEEAQALLDGATGGDWSVEVGSPTCVVSNIPAPAPDHGRWNVAALDGSDDHVQGDGAIMAASPALARTVIAQATTIRRLEALVGGRAPTDAELAEVADVQALIDREVGDLDGAQSRIDALAAALGDGHTVVLRLYTALDFARAGL